MAINIGDKRRLEGSWTNTATGAAVDPTTITVNITKPDGTKLSWVYGTDAEVVKDGTGEYHADVSLDQSGVWIYEWVGTGTAEEAEENTFTVQTRKTS